MFEDYVERSMTYGEYIRLIDDLLLKGRTTGPNQSKAMINYTAINRQRIHRLEKTIDLDESVESASRGAQRRVIWLVITEGWCGDAAQNIPVIEKIAAQSVNIETRYILRDENPDLMDKFLTDGKRSIPKLIAMDAATREVLGTWGSRPAPAQALFLELKEQGVAKLLITENLQRWYNADRGKTIQAEFVKFIEQGEGEQVSKARV